MKTLLALFIMLGSFSNCFANDFKWSCSVKDTNGGTTYVRNGASKYIAKKKAQNKCLEFSTSGACKLRGCSETE